jgi:hypothetical protein
MESFAPYHSFSGNISGMGREPMPNIYMPSHNLGGRPIASQTFNGNGIAVASFGTDKGRGGVNRQGMRSMRGFMKANRPMMANTQAFASAAPLSDSNYNPHPNIQRSIPRQNIINGPRFNPTREIGMGNYYNNGANCSSGTCGNMGQSTGMVRGRWGPQGDQTGYGGGGANQVILARLKRNILKTINKLKIQPNWSDLTVDGGALWKYSNMVKGNSIWCRVFNRVEVCTGRHAHPKPVPYLATLSTTTKIKLDPKVAQQVQDLLPQIGYCSSDNVLRISMDTLEHNLAVLAIICGIQQGKFNIYQVRRNGLVEKYLQLTTPGHRRYHPYAKYKLIKFIRTPKKN